MKFPPFPSRITALDAGRILPAIGFLAAPLAVFAPLGLAPLFILAAVLILAGDWRRASESLWDLSVFSTLLLTLVSWGALSAIWSIIPAHSLLEAARLLLECAGGLILLRAAATLESEERNRLLTALIVGLTLAMLLLVIERITRGAITHWVQAVPADKRINMSRFDRGVTMMALMFWVVAAGLGPRRRWWIFILLLPVTFAIILELNSRAAMLATILSVPGFVLAYFWPRVVAATLIAILLLGGLALPEFTPDAPAIARIQQFNHRLNDQSYLHRLGIWHFASDRIHERPWFGWGMDASRAVPGGQQEMSELMPQIHWLPPAQAMPLHPHNAPIQWRLELGVFGVLITAGLLGRIFWLIATTARLDRFRRASAAALATSAAVIALFAYGTWQSWWICGLWLTGTFFIGVAIPSEDRS